MKKTMAILFIFILSIILLAGCSSERNGANTPPVTQLPDGADTPAPTPTPAPDDSTEAPPAKPEPVLGPLIEEPYFSLNEAEGWVFADNSGYLTLSRGPDSDAEMWIHTGANTTPEEELEDALFFEDATQLENMSFGSIEYMVVVRTEMPIITLITTKKHTVKSEFDGVYEEASDHEVVMTIELYASGIEEAAPVLNTIKFNEKVLAVE